MCKTFTGTLIINCDAKGHPLSHLTQKRQMLLVRILLICLLHKVSHAEKGVIRSQRQLPAQSRGSLQDEIEDMIVPNHRLQLGEIVGQGITRLL